MKFANIVVGTEHQNSLIDCPNTAIMYEHEMKGASCMAILMWYCTAMPNQASKEFDTAPLKINIFNINYLDQYGLMRKYLVGVCICSDDQS